MKLQLLIRPFLRKPYNPLVPLPTFAAVGALGLIFAAACPANAAIDDGIAPSLLTAFDPGDPMLSLGTGLDIRPANAPAISLASYPRAGWQATLSTRAHGVRGTVTIVDADTFRVDNFFYDGGGIDVHFIVAAADDNNLFRTNRVVTDLNLLGTPHNGDSVTIDLPAGTTLDGYNAISLWCIPAQANFGSGTFVDPVPEPASAGLLVLGAITLGGFARRRQRQVAK